MTEIDKERGVPRSSSKWGVMAAVAFIGVIGLAVTDAVDGTIALILMLVPAALFFQAIRTKGRTEACGPTRGARRRYMRRVALFSSAYLVVIAIQVSWLSDGEASMALRVGLSVLPGLAILGVFWAIGRLIVEEQDEFIRMLIIRQTLIATGLALGLATLWGFLEAGDAVPHIDAYWFAVTFFFGQLIGAISNKISYGSWGSL